MSDDIHYTNFLVKITEMLLEKSNVNAKDNYGSTVIWRVVFASQGRGEIIKLLLTKGADPDIKNNSNMSALELAKIIANYNVKQYLIG